MEKTLAANALEGEVKIATLLKNDATYGKNVSSFWRQYRSLIMSFLLAALTVTTICLFCDDALFLVKTETNKDQENYPRI